MGHDTHNSTAPGPRPPAILRVCLGGILLGAAALKTYSLTGDHRQLELPLGSLPLLVALIAVEVVLGSWFISGLAYPLSWLGLVGFFSLAVAVNVAQVVDGQTACHCFGAFQVPPWLTLLLDVATVCVLLRYRPHSLSELEQGRFRFAARLLAGTGVVLVAVAAFATVRFGSVERGLAQLRHELVVATPSRVDLGHMDTGETRLVDVRLTNRDAKPIVIVGGETSCVCASATNLPLTLSPGGTETLRLSVTAQTAGVFRHRFRLYTDCPRQTAVVVAVSGRPE